MVLIVKGKIHSDHGFYIGDISYVLSEYVFEHIYCKNRRKEGIYKVGAFQFAVSTPASSDTYYRDMEGNQYCVDEKNIGIVPLELVDVVSATDVVVRGSGEAKFLFDKGVFKIGFSNNALRIIIDTNLTTEVTL